MELPPGEPVTINKSLSALSTMVGDMEERGRAPGRTMFAASGSLES